LIVGTQDGFLRVFDVRKASDDASSSDQQQLCSIKRAVGSVLSLDSINGNGVRWSTSDGIVLQLDNIDINATTTTTTTKVFTGVDVEPVFDCVLNNDDGSLFTVARDGAVRRYIGV
jgi:hypothetical protein